ncbi:MAG: 50S ribosomal protein L3 [Planctomycetes bacterium]|nr:50S ribosomal protein L3 [Planctomycetota bacterium]
MTAPKYILGRKVGMSHVFSEDGRQIPVTVISAGPCKVAQVKTVERDGYLALQLAFEPCRAKVLTKPRDGHLKKAGVGPHRVLREVRLDAPADLAVGAEIKVDVFQPGDRVDVIGTVKGRGFQGVVRVHNFSGKRHTHGNMNQRGPGSIGMHSQPGMVLKGHRMATHWGDERATVRNLEVVSVDAENNALVVRGAIPGSRRSFVAVRVARACRVRQSS